MEALLPMADPLSEWEWIAVRCPLSGLRERLEQHQIGAYHVRGTDAALMLSVNTTKDTHKLALWIAALGGSVGYRPKDNLRLMGAVLADCDLIARTSNCSAVRVEPGLRGDWKLNLLPRFGFHPLDIDGLTVMQKDLA